MKANVSRNGARVGITGVGVYVPERVLTNADLERMVDTSDEWITDRTGIKERRIAADDEAASDLAIPAARQALEQAGVDPGELDLVIVATSTPDMLFPTTVDHRREEARRRPGGGLRPPRRLLGLRLRPRAGVRRGVERRVPEGARRRLRGALEDRQLGGPRHLRPLR